MHNSSRAVKFHLLWRACCAHAQERPSGTQIHQHRSSGRQFAVSDLGAGLHTHGWACRGNQLRAALPCSPHSVSHHRHL